MSVTITITIITKCRAEGSFTLPSREPSPSAQIRDHQMLFQVQSNLEPPDAPHFHRAIKWLK